MSGRSKNWHRAFAKHCHEWQNRVGRDSRLTGSERNIAKHVASNYLNRETMTAWPSHGTIASDLSVSVKTVQRAMKKLAAFDHLEVGRRRRNSNTYVFPLIKEAVDREMQLKLESGQHSPADRTRRSGESGHRSPTNLNKEHIKEPCVRPTAPRCGKHRFAPGSSNARKWTEALRAHDLDSLDAWNVLERSLGEEEYAMPSPWPPKDEAEWQIVRAYLAWCGPVAKNKSDC